MKKIVIITTILLVLISPDSLLAALPKNFEITLPPDLNNPPPPSFCKNSNNRISAYINNQEYPFNTKSNPGMARDIDRNVKNKVDNSGVTWRSMSGRPELVIWEKDNNILRILYDSPNNQETDIFWWPEGEALDKALYFTLAPSQFPGESIFWWVTRMQDFLDNYPIKADIPCPGQKVGPKRGANESAVNSCKDKWLDAPLMSTDSGKKTLEEEYKQLNDFFSNGTGGELFKPGGGGIITSAEDEAMYNTFFLTASLEDIDGDTYQEATRLYNDVETQFLSLLRSLGVGEENLIKCGQGALGAVGASVGMGNGVPASLKSCLWGPAALGQVGVEVLMRKMADKNITLIMAKQLHAFTYLRKYIEYRQCLAQKDPTIKETVDKELENYNNLNTLRNQQLQEIAKDDWENSVLRRVACWIRNAIIHIYYFLANFAAFFLQRNY